MGRTAGKPAYPGKTKAGMYYVTAMAYKLMRAAVRRTRKSESDIIEHCLRKQAAAITAATFEAEV